jgi:hypothetical protein
LLAERPVTRYAARYAAFETANTKKTKKLLPVKGFCTRLAIAKNERTIIVTSVALGPRVKRFDLLVGYADSNRSASSEGRNGDRKRTARLLKIIAMSTRSDTEYNRAGSPRNDHP